MTSVNVVEHCTSNERGTEQMTVVFNKTLWQKIFGLPPTTKIYIYVNGDWVNKKTRKCVNQDEWFMLEQLETQLRYDTIDDEGHLRRGRSTRRYSKKRTF